MSELDELKLEALSKGPRKSWALLKLEDAPDRDPRGLCTVAWVLHTELVSTERYARYRARVLAERSGALIRLVEIPDGDMYYPPGREEENPWL